MDLNSDILYVSVMVTMVYTKSKVGVRCCGVWGGEVWCGVVWCGKGVWCGGVVWCGVVGWVLYLFRLILSKRQAISRAVDVRLFRNLVAIVFLHSPAEQKGVDRFGESLFIFSTSLNVF